MADRTRPARALLRVLAAPAMLLTLWLAQMLAAKLLAGSTRSAAEAGLRGATWFPDGHRLRAMIELIVHEPAIAATIVSALTTSAILGALISVVAAPAILTRLSGERSTAMVLGATTKLPAVLVQTGYGLLFRAICTALAVLPAMLGAAGLPLVLVIGSFPILVLDRARAAVVLDDDRPYHPMTFVRAIGHVGKRPLWWITGSVLEALKLAIGIVALLLVIQASFASGSIWIARFAGLLAVIFGLWRVALAVDDRA